MNETLFAGRLIAAQFTDGTTAEVRVRQLPLRDYERAFALLDDEISLTAFSCEKSAESREQSGASLSPLPTPLSKAWAETLTPESYEAIRLAAEEVNAKGFFAWSARRLTKLAEQQQRSMEIMAALPPDALKLALDAGARLTSPSSSPISPRRPA